MLARPRLFAPAAAAFVPLLLAGCHVSQHRHGDGDSVSIDTPFASMHVKTDKQADTSALGVAVYPGAVPVKEHGDKDNDAADINMSFGDFHLGVKAASYQTGDGEDKVEAFYRKELAQYGDVIKCEDDRPVGEPARTAQGLSCDDNGHNGHHGHIDIHGSKSGNPELRAGSPQHQHIVGMEAKNGGTKIGLVVLDLPHGANGHSDKETE